MRLVGAETCVIKYTQHEHNDDCMDSSSVGLPFLSAAALATLRDITADNAQRPGLEIIKMYREAYAGAVLFSEGREASPLTVGVVLSDWEKRPKTAPRDSRIEEKDVQNMKARALPPPTRFF